MEPTRSRQVRQHIDTAGTARLGEVDGAMQPRPGFVLALCAPVKWVEAAPGDDKHAFFAPQHLEAVQEFFKLSEPIVPCWDNNVAPVENVTDAIRRWLPTTQAILDWRPSYPYQQLLEEPCEQKVS